MAAGDSESDESETSGEQGATDAAALSGAEPWPLLERLPGLIGGAPAALRELLTEAHEQLKARFLADELRQPLEQRPMSRRARRAGALFACGLGLV